VRTRQSVVRSEMHTSSWYVLVAAMLSYTLAGNARAAGCRRARLDGSATEARSLSSLLDLNLRKDDIDKKGLISCSSLSPGTASGEQTRPRGGFQRPW